MKFIGFGITKRQKFIDNNWHIPAKITKICRTSEYPNRPYEVTSKGYSGLYTESMLHEYFYIIKYNELSPIVKLLNI